MNQKMIFFLFFIIAVYFGVHYFVFRTAVFFLKIESSRSRNIFFAGMALLALSFIGSTFLVHYTDNFFARSFYFFSGVWVGVLTNLCLASLVSWIFYGAFHSISFALNSKIVFLLAYFLALVVSVWGIWNVYNPVVKRVDVQIEGLPENWKGKTIVQLSDVHLGNVLGAKYMEKLARRVDELGPEAVFLTGDIFDGVGSDLERFIMPIDHMEAPEGIYFVTGNHETYLGVDTVYKALKKSKVRVLKDEVVESNGVNIFGVSYPERNESKNVGGIIMQNREAISEKPTILLKHDPTLIEQAKEAGVDLQLSGHTHHGQLFPFNLITRAIFRGFDFGLHKIGNFSIYTSSGAGVWGPTMRTSSRGEIVAITLK